MSDAWIGGAVGLLGVLIGVGAGYLRDRLQVREQRVDHVNAVRRTTYAQFLVAASSARNLVSGLPDPLEWTLLGSTEPAPEVAKHLPTLYEELRLVAGSTVCASAESVVDLLVNDLRIAGTSRARFSRMGHDDEAERLLRETVAVRKELDERLADLRSEMQRELGIVRGGVRWGARRAARGPERGAPSRGPASGAAEPRP